MTVHLWQFEAVGTRPVIDQAAFRLGEMDPSPALSVAVFEVDGAPHLRRLQVLFDHIPNRDALMGWAGLVGAEVDTVGAPLAEDNWVQRSLDGLPAVKAGRFVVRGGHHARCRGGQTDIVIEAGEAFGTGHHGTTTGCLQAMDRVMKRMGAGPTMRVLDVGTGSGVLAIAAAKAVRAQVDATDIDPVAVDFARQAAQDNGVAARVRCLVADGLGRFAGGAYPLVLANILAGPLVTLAPHLSAATARGGWVIVSGLLTHQIRPVAAALRNAGLVREHTLVINDWATLTFAKR